ncbi:hypothetical protein ES702_01853 [subsurface metagenome]
MRKAKLIIVLLALSFTLTSNLTAEAATDEWVTRTLDEDLFFAAYRFDDVDMVYLQGDEMQIRSWFRFEGPVVVYGRYIIEAYLSVKVASVGGTDPGASMTIYGVPAKKGGALSYYDAPDQINGPYTNSYNVNLSSFVDAGAWHNITVTNILREINQGYYHYDGHDVAFVTLSSSGHEEERTITSEESGNAAKLYIHYGEPDPPPGLPPDSEWVEDYRNYSIWRLPSEDGKMEYVWTTFTDPGFPLQYDNISGTGPYTIDAVSNAQGSFAASQRKLVRTSDDELYVVYWASNRVRVMNSIDEGVTWIDETIISQAQTCIYPSIAIDSNDVLHVVYQNDVENAIYYVNYTGSWSTPLAISIGPGGAWEHELPSIAIDGNGTLHVAYSGEGTAHAFYQVWYVNYTTSWSTPLRISTDGSMQNYVQEYAAIATDSLNHVHIAWMGNNGTGGVHLWHIEKTTSWGNITRISTQTGHFPSIAIDPDDGPHITWDGSGSGESHDQIWENNYNGTAWQGPLEISTKAGMDNHHQAHPSIAIDSNDTRYIIFQGKTTGTGDGEIWLSTYTDSWNTPVKVQDVGLGEYSSNLKYPFDIKTGALVVTDENGTIVWTEENGYDISDVEDIIDEDIIGYPDPEDPDPPGWDEESWLSASRFKLILFIIGMALFLGSPVYGFAERPEAATWIILMMNMIVGVALLWSLQTM